jgi:hypothetical protein
MATNMMDFLPYILAKQKAKKHNVKVPNEALIGLLPQANPFITNYLVTDMATKKAIEKKEKEESVAMLNEIVNKRVAVLNAAAAGDPVVVDTKAFSPRLRIMIGTRMNPGAVRDDILK